MGALHRMLGLKSARRQVQEERRRADKQLKNLSGGADCWQSYDFLARARGRQIDGIPDARCFTLQSALRSLRNVDGDVAECGVRLGKSTIFMLESDLRKRTYHLFDSFEGLPEPTANDVLSHTGASYWTKGDITAPESETRANLNSYSGVNIYRGWIPERFAEVEQRRFALVHIDVDLYEPTRDSLTFLWPRLVPEGILICDDYGFSTCPGAKQAVDEFFLSERVHLIELATGQAIAMRRAASGPDSRGSPV